MAPPIRLKRFATFVVIFTLYCVIAAWSNSNSWNNLRTSLASPSPLDALLNTYTLNWEYRWMTDRSISLKRFVDGLIFYPTEYTLGLTENLLGLQLLFFPLRYITGDAILAYNLIVFFSFPISAFTQFLLLKWLTGHTLAAFFGGWIWGFSPMRYAQMSHLQLLPVWWFSLASLSLFKFFERPSMLLLIATNLAFILQFTSSISGGVFLACILGIIAIGSCVSRWQQVKEFYCKHANAVWGLVLANLVLGAAVYWPYYRASRLWPIASSLNENTTYSAELQNYLSAAAYHPLYGSLTSIFSAKDASWEKWLFIGATPLLLGILSVVSRNSPALSCPKSICFKSLYWTTAIGFILSLGPHLLLLQHNTHIPLPYTLAYYVLPGWKSLRVPSRFSILVLFGVSAWCALTIRRLHQRLTARSRRWSLVALLTGVLLLDTYHQIPTVPKPAKESVQDLVSFLNREHPQRPIGFIPIRIKSAHTFDEFVQALTRDAERQYVLSETSRRMVNGYSRLSSSTYDSLADSYAHKSLSDVLQDMRGIGVYEVVVENGQLTDAERLALEQLVAQGRVRQIATLHTHQIVELMPGQGSHDASH